MVRDGSEDPRGSLRRVEEPLGRSGTGWGGAGRGRKTLERSGTAPKILEEVRDGSRDTR